VLEARQVQTALPFLLDGPEVSWGLLSGPLTWSSQERLEVRAHMVVASCRAASQPNRPLGFLYIASVSVIPELLAESRSGKQTIKEVSQQSVQDKTPTINV
jgi:hypothetical protein